MSDKNLIKYTTALTALKALCENNESIGSQDKFMKHYGVSSYFFQAVLKLEIIKKTGTPNVYQWMHKKADNETSWLIGMNVQGKVREIQQAYTNKSRINHGLPAKIISIKKPQDTIQQAIDDFKKNHVPTAEELYPEGYQVVQNNDGKPDTIVPIAKGDSLVGSTRVTAEYIGNLTMEAALDKLRALALRKAIKGLTITIDYIG